MRTELSKITQKRLAELGYSDEMSVRKVFYWLMESKHYYIMPFPKPENMWGCIIAILGKPNSSDGKMNIFEMDLVTKSYDSALLLGVEFQVKILYDVQRRVLRMSPEEKQALLEECRKKGLDF